MSTEIDDLKMRVAALELALIPIGTWSNAQQWEREISDEEVIKASDRLWHSLACRFAPEHNWEGNTPAQAREACRNPGHKFFRKIEASAEPAPGSDAEHPPAGYRLAKVGEKRAHGFLYRFCKTWVPDYPPDKRVGEPYQESQLPIANPIPANEGDSRLAESVAIPVGWKAVPEGIHREIPVKIRRRIASGAGLGLLIYPDPSIPWGEGYEAILPSEATEGDEYWSVDRWWKSGGGRCHPSVPGYFAWRRRIPATTPTEPERDLSDKIAESVVQDLQQACHDRDELRATVERLEAELETTKRLLAESLVERDRLKNLHDARKVRIEGFRDVLRERLGDLV